MTLNTLDKIIGYFSPTALVRRSAARQRLEVLAAYDGAKTGRRMGDWLSSGASANVEIGKDLPRLRERSRELTRNNHFARNIQSKWSDSIVGPGILCRWEDPDLQELWDEWTKRASADGQPHFEACQHLVCDSEWESGEVLIRRRPRQRADGVWPPFQVQVLESDYLDTSKTHQTGTGYIIHGVQFNLFGQREGYWLFGQHPGDVVTTGVRGGLSMTSAFVPASEVLHVYEQRRPGQVRGVPRPSAVMLRMRDLDDWEDAEIVRKRTESCMAAFVTSPDEEGFAFSNQVLDQQGNTVETFQPAMVIKGRPGEEITFNQPTYAGGYDDYKTSVSRDIAAGTQMPFELVTGNYSKSNYSSSRMGVCAYERTVESMRWNVIIPQACEPVAQWFLEFVTIFRGPVKNSNHEWQPPKFNLLDREAEAKADQIELQLGTTAWMDAVSRQGLDPEKQLAKIKRYANTLKELGLNFFGGKADAAPKDAIQQ